MAASRFPPGNAGAFFDARGPVSAQAAAKLGNRITVLESAVERAIVAIEEGRKGDALRELKAVRRQGPKPSSPPTAGNAA